MCGCADVAKLNNQTSICTSVNCRFANNINKYKQSYAKNENQFQC